MSENEDLGKFVVYFSTPICCDLRLWNYIYYYYDYKKKYTNQITILLYYLLHAGNAIYIESKENKVGISTKLLALLLQCANTLHNTHKNTSSWIISQLKLKLYDWKIDPMDYFFLYNLPY